MCVEIAITNDSLVEFDEFFSVRAQSPDPTVNIPVFLATVIIVDDDGEH